MQGLRDGVGLAAHPDAFHEPPRGGVVGEAVRGDAAQAELGEAEPDELADGFGGVAVAGVVGVQYPAEVGLGALRLWCDLGLGPRVLDGEHQVPDDLPVELDDEGLGETGGILEAGAVLLQGGWCAGQPAADVGEPAEPPGGLEVVAGRGPQRQPVGTDRPVDGVQGVAGHLRRLLARGLSGETRIDFGARCWGAHRHRSPVART